MTEQEKIMMLERENKLLKELIELLKQINKLQHKGYKGTIADPVYTPYYPFDEIIYVDPQKQIKREML